MDNLQILLNKNKSKKSVNVNNSLTINFVGSEKMLPCDAFGTSLSEYEVYNNERLNCNKVRLTLCVNPICSNVLFNNVTEIVRNEGTNDVEWLNYDSNLDFEGLKFKEENEFKNNNLAVLNAIRDTQLSNSEINFTYHCGIDIFNNHLLRSNTFKTVCPLESDNAKTSEFNTINDLMRSYEGKQIEGYSDKGTATQRPDVNLHLYLNDEITPYKDTITKKLIEENGWFGFTNIGKLKVYDDDSEDPRHMDYDWFKVINNRKSCDFIDMYPHRELYYFDPRYNSVRQRLEKNWHYFLSYPSSSTTEGIEFIKTHENGSTSLKVMYFDDTVKAMNGTTTLKIWSVSKHGLKKGDTINVYKGDNVVLRNVEIYDVVDDYIFYVYNKGIRLCEEWVILEKDSDEAYLYDENGGILRTFTVSDDKKTLSEGNDLFYIINYEKANVDVNAQDISFTRVVQNNEVEYYVRIFSKLPNWKFADKQITEKLLYQDDLEYIKEYQKVPNEFDNTIGKMAFSKNIYNDNVTQVVFTDDIRIDSLRDNLGRPLTDIYFTIIKNNHGYKEWYGKNKEIDIKNENVEYSHCFGKVNCAFKLSDASIPNEDYNNLSLINNIDNTFSRNGLDMSLINENRPSELDNDEIQYYEIPMDGGDVSDSYSDLHYYGDLCCYSRVVCDEQIIQDIGYRFNTTQRELDASYKAYDFITGITYDEIQSDDYDDVGFKTKTYDLNMSVQRKEGYYYNPHYRIRIKTFDSNLTTIYPKFLTPKRIESYNGKTKLYTMENHELGNGDKMYIYDLVDNIKYDCMVLTVSNKRNLILDVELPDYSDKRRYKYFKVFDDIPSYAFFMSDGSCRYVYRNILQNGFDDYSDIEIYPFTSGSLYINKNINLFLRRQNPKGEYDIRSKAFPYDINTNNISYEKENKYYEEENILC